MPSQIWSDFVDRWFRTVALSNEFFVCTLSKRTNCSSAIVSSLEIAVHLVIDYIYFVIQFFFFVSFSASSFPRRLPGAFDDSVVRARSSFSAVYQRSTFTGLVRIFPITVFKRYVEEYRRSSFLPVRFSLETRLTYVGGIQLYTSIYSCAFQSLVPYFSWYPENSTVARIRLPNYTPVRMDSVCT